ncbi:MAG: hypothetical protein IKF72_11770 [Kiritimatiellae bacterium]|nr:hypothetical protein [Kiritimatiellia bacterium]
MKASNTVKLAAFACATLCGILLAKAGDVFSDAVSWHRGFVGSGAFVSGSTTQFPECLKLGDTSDASHAVAVSGYNKADANQITLRSERVIYPYANVTNDETVGYFQQKVIQNGNYCAIYSSVLKPYEPFVVSNANEYTFFVRFRWDGPIAQWNTSKVTNLVGQAYIFNADYNYNGKCGMMLGMYSSGGLHWNAGQNYGGLGFTVATNKWADCAIVVKNGLLNAYFCQEGGLLQTNSVSLPAGALSTPTAPELRLGGLKGEKYTNIPLNNGDGDGDAWKAFRGSIHSFASWPRALSADEVRQVFAWPKTDLVRLGTVNGSSLEFAGGTSSATTAGAQTDHALMPATLTAEHPSVTISFDVPAQDVGLGQVLRVTATGGGQMAVSASVNGAAAGAMSLRTGQTELLFLKGELFNAGANTITLTRTASTGDVAFDAIALGGGFQLGNQDNSETSDFSDTNASYLHYYATDGNWKHVMGRIMGINESHNYRKTRLHVYIPDEVAGNASYSVRFSFRVKVQDGPSGQPVGVYLNGAETPLLSKPVASGAWREFKCKVSAENLLAGDNAFVIANDYPCDTYTGLFGFDCFRFETVFNNGLTFVIR